MTDVRIGLAGTGFIARHFQRSLVRHDGFRIERVLTRRPPGSVTGFTEITNSIDDLVSHVDVVVECSGDPIWATDLIEAAVEAGVPVVTMNTEFHITTGSAFVGNGLVTEAEGDQPGCLAALHEDAVAMGFEPIVYGNMKGFLNPDPTPEDMEYWGEKQGISLAMVTSFTDGTKVQAEQILVANHFGATLVQEGLLGPSVTNLAEGASKLAVRAREARRPVSDFIVNSRLPHGVFIVATHDEMQRDALEYLKMGPGPDYTLIKNNILVHLEILKTVRRVLESGATLLDNSSQPEFSLAAVAKRRVEAGERIPQGIGSFALRGHALRISEHPDHVPIGLIRDALINGPIEEGAVVTFDQVELPESRAVDLWKGRILSKAIESGQDKPFEVAHP